MVAGGCPRPPAAPQACSRGLIYEGNRENAASSSTGMNRAYGAPKNVYFGYYNSIVAGQDGKTIGAKNFLYFKTIFSIYFRNSFFAK
jgi:hypothetical protein